MIGGQGVGPVRLPGGGGRGGKGWRAGRGRRLWPSLPVSYSRAGFAGHVPAGWCPRLWTGVAAAATGVAGVVPAAASIPARRRLVCGFTVSGSALDTAGAAPYRREK
jgi:hypothetical protein